MNEKLTYCAHVVELVKSHMAEQKSIRIEILIVLLILIEVSYHLMAAAICSLVINARHSCLEGRRNPTQCCKGNIQISYGALGVFSNRQE